VRIKFKFNNLPKITPFVFKEIDDVITKTVLDIQAEAQGNAPVRTGALRASIHIVTMHENTYGPAVAEAQQLNPEAEFSGGTYVAKPLKGKVVVPIHYGIWNEYGENGRPAYMYLTRAFDAHGINYMQALKDVLSRAGGS